MVRDLFCLCNSAYPTFLINAILPSRWLIRFKERQLIGSFRNYQQLAEELSQRHGIPHDQASKITASYLKQFRKCPDNVTYTLDIWRTTLWSKALGEQYSYLAAQTYERWLCLRYRYLAMTPDTIAMISYLRKKYLLGLITNGPSNAQWEKVHKLGLEQHFDIILVSGDLSWEKPDARIFEEACRYLRVSPENCIMVGDKLETDILGKSLVLISGGRSHEITRTDYLKWQIKSSSSIK